MGLKRSKRNISAAQHKRGAHENPAVSLESSNQTGRRLHPILITLGLLFLVILSNADVIQTALIWLLPLAAIAILVLLRKQPSTFTCMPILSLIIYMIVIGASTFIAISGKFAMNEYSKLLMAFSAFILLFTYLQVIPAKKETRLRAVCLGISFTAAVIGLVSVDGNLSRFFAIITSPFTAGFLDKGGVEANTRILSVLDNPNSFAGFVGIGIFTSLALMADDTTPARRRLYLCLLEICSLSFLLAFSLGACLSIALGFIVLLIFTTKCRRARMIAAMIQVLLVTLIISFFTFPVLDGNGLLPLVYSAVACVLVLLSDHFVASPLLRILSGHSKTMIIATSMLATVIIAFTVLAINLTGSASLSAGDTLRRAVNLTGGGYVLYLEGGDNVNVMIESQNEREVIIHSSNMLYKGPASGAVFTVPDDSLMVYFNFSAETEALIEKAAINSPDETLHIPLRYLLLPGFISNRLQGLSANENAIQRFAFFSDGIKLFSSSPLLGHGIGSFESAVKSVQDFYYETKYVHNHYIQALSDAGILGLGSFIFLLFAMFRAIIRARKNGRKEFLLPSLAGCLAFIAVHISVEVTFSNSYYLVLAFSIFALASVQEESPETETRTSHLTTRNMRPAYSRFSIPIGAVACTLCLVFTILWGMSTKGQHLAASRSNSADSFFINLERAAKIDYYNRNDYLLSYIVNVVSLSREDLTPKADLYAEELSHKKSNSTGEDLVSYYLYRNRPEKAFELAVQSMEYVKSDETKWRSMFATLNSSSTWTGYVADPTAYETGTMTLFERFQTVAAEQLDNLKLDQASLFYIERMRKLSRTNEKSSDEAFNLFNMVFSLSYVISDNNDKLTVSVSMPEGGVSFNENGANFSAGTEMSISFNSASVGYFNIEIQSNDQQAITLTDRWGDELIGSDENGKMTYLLSTIDPFEHQITIKASSDVIITSLEIIKW